MSEAAAARMLKAHRIMISYMTKIQSSLKRILIKTFTFFVFFEVHALNLAHGQISNPGFQKVKDAVLIERARGDVAQNIIIEIEPKRPFRFVAEEAKVRFSANELRFTEREFYRTSEYAEYVSELNSISTKIFSPKIASGSKLSSIYFKQSILIAEVRDIYSLRWIASQEEVKGIYMPPAHFWQSDSSDMLFDGDPNCFFNYCHEMNF